MLSLSLSPVSVVFLAVEAVPVNFSELDPGAVEEVGVDLLEAQHAADQLLVEEVVAVHGLGDDNGHLRGDKLNVRVALSRRDGGT